ncbi:MAG: hypothetical protein EBR09_07455 [Proteobacteria bacterium]|nr:hypothetical protein [Pseudomonadota bacterium]
MYVDDKQEPVVLEHGAEVADTGGAVCLDAAHGAQGHKGARPGEGAADADDIVAEDHERAGEVDDLELGLCDKEDVLDKDAVVVREWREHGLGDVVVEVLLQHNAEGAGLAHGAAAFKYGCHGCGCLHARRLRRFARPARYVHVVRYGFEASGGGAVFVRT